MRPAYLTEERIRGFIAAALKEDIGNGDHTSLGAIDKNAMNQAQLILKSEGKLAGMELADRIFHFMDPSIEVELLKNDGDMVEPGDIGFKVSGNSQAILAVERLVLNCIQRMSGIATYTDYMKSLIKGSNAKLIDTRKTTPLFRLPEKWAVLIGGGVNHRFGLYDMILLKDNHIDFVGSAKLAVERIIDYLVENELALEIEIEVRNLYELEEILGYGEISRVLLDNMLPSDIRQAVNLIANKFETEASGGVTEKNVSDIAETGIDYISVGALTHSYNTMDVSLKAI